MPVTGARKALSHLYRPQAAKYITTVAATPGTTAQVLQAVDLTVPIRGFRLVMKGRLVIGTANMTSVNPEHFLNLLQNLLIQGISKRQGGNVLLWNTDLASLFIISHLTDVRGGTFTINNQANGEVQQFAPSSPLTFYGVGTNGAIIQFTGAVGTYDYKVVVDLPAYPFDAPPGVRAAYILRQDEYKDSIQMKFQFSPADTNAAPQGLGVPAATTTLTFSSYGSGAGNPTLDIYSLPVILGDVRNQVLPGIVSRTFQPITQPLAATGNNVELLRLQKQSTPRMYIKVGTQNANGFFNTLSDGIITAIGLLLGTDRNVRDVLDIFAHKQEVEEMYGTPPIQGYIALDFVQSGNSDSSYPGDELGDGTTFRLVANVTTAANALATVMQEQILYKPEGALVGG